MTEEKRTSHQFFLLTFEPSNTKSNVTEKAFDLKKFQYVETIFNVTLMVWTYQNLIYWDFRFDISLYGYIDVEIAVCIYRFGWYIYSLNK